MMDVVLLAVFVRARAPCTEGGAASWSFSTDELLGCSIMDVVSIKTLCQSKSVAANDSFDSDFLVFEEKGSTGVVRNADVCVVSKKDATNNKKTERCMTLQVLFGPSNFRRHAGINFLGRVWSRFLHWVHLG